MSDDPEQALHYQVLINHEAQYAIWLADRAPPRGWREAGKRGSRSDCLSWVKETWVDPRPLSLRRRIEGNGARAAS
jgi:MbtH protein